MTWIVYVGHSQQIFLSRSCSDTHIWITSFSKGKYPLFQPETLYTVQYRVQHSIKIHVLRKLQQTFSAKPYIQSSASNMYRAKINALGKHLSAICPNIQRFRR